MVPRLSLRENNKHTAFSKGFVKLFVFSSSILTLFLYFIVFLILVFALWQIQTQNHQEKNEEVIFENLAKIKDIASDAFFFKASKSNLLEQNDVLSENFTEADENYNNATEKAEKINSSENSSGDLSQNSDIYLNPDLYGWISIEDTVLNYPVMFSPNDPEFYLHHDYYGNYSDSGVPFVAADCFPGSKNTIIYGHNMKNGTMFKTITYYSDETFYKSHPYIHFETSCGESDYKVVSAFYASIDENVSDVFKYYEYFDLRDADRFNEYSSQVKALSLYETGETPVYGDELITLSTCSYHVPENGRFVVVAKKI